MWSLEMEDYSSEASVDIYNQLLDIGSTWFGGIAFDPNAQNPTIEIINVLSAPEPVDPITWDAFDATTQNIDGNRYIYYNNDWKGWNPVLSLTSPAETALRIGADYLLIPTGGFILLNDSSGAGSPGISDGMTLRATSYQTA